LVVIVSAGSSSPKAVEVAKDGEKGFRWEPVVTGVFAVRGTKEDANRSRESEVTRVSAVEVNEGENR
jgi:hypothetical protein